MEPLTPFIDTMLPLAVSLALGLLIGLERGWKAREGGEGSRVAGVRTYGLIGLLGGVCGLVSEKPALIFAGLGFLGLAAVLIAAHYHAVRKTGDLGITSLCASLLTFAFGAAVSLDYLIEASAAAVVTAILLGSKPQLHRGVRALGEEELRAALKLLLISVVVLPILPNEGYGPWNALNPFEIWWMVVLIAAISFLGYFAMKIAGTGKGAILTGLFAGLASSTALTLHFSRLAHRRPSASPVLAAGILLACGTMFPRMLIVASVVYWPLFQVLVLPALVMAAIVYAAAFIPILQERRKDNPEADKAQLSNPLELRSAVFFGVLLAAIMLAGETLERTYGETGILALAAISGITDVDAITLTLSKMGGSMTNATPVTLATLGIVLASASNGLTKAGITFVVGGPAIGWRVAVPLILAAMAGLAIAGLNGSIDL